MAHSVMFSVAVEAVEGGMCCALGTLCLPHVSVAVMPVLPCHFTRQPLLTYVCVCVCVCRSCFMQPFIGTLLTVNCRFQRGMTYALCALALACRHSY